MNTVSIAQLRPELWQKELLKVAIDDNFFARFMGEGDNNIIVVKNDLKKSKGDQVTIPITAKLTGAAITGDNEAEGNEQAITSYYAKCAIDQARFPVRLTGKLDEQKNAFDMRKDAKDKLGMAIREFIERQIFLKLAGVANTSLTDVAGNVVGTNAAWSNTGAQVPTTDSAAGYGKRYLCADYAAGATSLAATDLMTPQLISMAKYKAMQKQASGLPKINPLRIEGKDYYVMFMHPWQALDLKNNATYAQAQREAQVRGDKNPIFTGALGIWDGVILYEHEYCPFLDISVAGHNFESSSAGTDYATVDAFRALLCGQQAGVMVQTNESLMMVEETFDYKNKVGYCTGLIGGINKVTLTSSADAATIDYGVIAVDTAATAIA